MLSSTALGEEYNSISYQNWALAPNAGGQNAHALRLVKDDIEYGAFVNEYLRAGDHPLMGVTMDWRYGMCTSDCWMNFYAQPGIGASIGGPLAQITWSTQIPILPLWLPVQSPAYLPQLRIDFTTQFIFVRYRAVTWSYPLWWGITVPF